MKYKKHKRQAGVVLYVNANGFGFLEHLPVLPGNDKNDGLSLSSPLKTISKAVELLRVAKPLDGRVKFKDVVIIPIENKDH